MPPSIGVVQAASHGGDRAPAKPAVQPPLMSESFAKDAIIAWFQGEFAAANAIIDALCSHLIELEGGAPEAYKSVFAAIHQRRMNWIPILQMQRYYPIADVAMELKKVASKKEEEEKADDDVVDNERVTKKEEKVLEGGHEGEVVDGDGDGDGDGDDESPPESEITDSGSQEVHPFPEHIDICSNHEECDGRRAQIKMTKGFSAKEPVRGHMVNVVKSLKLYENVFTEPELSKLNDFVNELRAAGRNGELSGTTFILYNQQMKGKKRELIQLGVSIFGQIKEDARKELHKSYIEPIPSLLEGVIEHLIQWRLIPEHKRPNSCIINFFDEGEYSQPFLKPPHLDQPLSTLLLSESRMAFGRSLSSDSEGNYRAPLILSLKEGSLLVMRGNSSDTARHAMCSSDKKRVSITFFRVRTDAANNLSERTPFSKAMTLWQPGGAPTPYTAQNNYDPTSIVPKWGILQSPMVMLAPVRPVIANPQRAPRGGTGVFLPWTMGSRRPPKHLPPRAQRARLLSLPSPCKTHNTVETSSDSGGTSP